MRGTWKSSVYFPLPVKRAGSSRRLIRSPRTPLISHPPFGGALDRLDDVVVPRAAAEVPLERVADLVLAWVRIGFQERRPGHHHPRRAVAALEPVFLPERLLQGMELAVGRHALDRRHLRAVGLHRQLRARLDRLAID